jgi:hypothetical protein
MKEVSHLIRKAFIDELSPFTIEGVTIPIFDNRINPQVTIPNYKGGSAYIIILDQNEVETTSNECTLDQTATITFDIVVKYPTNFGGMLASELISNQLQQAVIGFNGVTLTLSDSKIKIQRITKIAGNSFVENGASLTSYRKRITFSIEIYETQ